MNIEDWLKWPTNSKDPAVNLTVAVLLVSVIIVALVVGALVVIPIAAVLGIAKAVHWYANRPAPTSYIQAQAQQRVIAANFPKPEDFVDGFVARLLESWEGEFPAYTVYAAMAEIAGALYETENLGNPVPPAPMAGAIEEGRHRDRLLAHMRKSADAPATLAAFSNTLFSAFANVYEALPPVARATPGEFAKTGELKPFATVPLVDVLPDVGQAVWDVITPFFSGEGEQIDLFADLRYQFERNAHDASGLPYPAPSERLVLPCQYKGSPREIVGRYLVHTPFEQLFDVEVPFSFSDEARFEHMHVIGGSGHGKTQLLQHLVHHDLTRDDPPALIIIDSQGDMLRKIQKLDLFSRPPLRDKLVIIDPEDVEYPPALNMFDMTNARLSGYSRAHREQIEAGIIELYNYIFGALAAEMTQKQGTAFAFVSRLLLSMPGATIHTLRELIEDGAPDLSRSRFAGHIAQLDPTAQAFFQNQFFSKSFTQTKQAIARRLYGVLQVPAFDRMFSAERNKLDMFEAMQEGRIVLVNTSKALLKTDASALFGRYVIALALRAAIERVAVSDRPPAFLVVDEAAEYFDENLEALLSQARKFALGITFAHQHLDQLSPALRSSVAVNTSIKLAGGISDRDARTLAPDMRTTAKFITSMQKRHHATEFACYVRNGTANAIRLRIPFGTIEGAQRMSSQDAAELIAHNRERYTVKEDVAGPKSAVAAADPASRDVSSTSDADDWRS